MSNEVEFVDYSIHVKAEISNAVIAWLHEFGSEIKSQAQRNTKVNTGQLKGSWENVVDDTSYTATIGSPLENAIWEEYGTGQYAVNGDGRKTPWSYQDAKGNWHHTIGKKPQRALQKAFDKARPKAQKSLENKLKEME